MFKKKQLPNDSTPQLQGDKGPLKTPKQPSPEKQETIKKPTKEPSKFMKFFSKKKKTESDIYEKNVKIPDYEPKDQSEDNSEHSVDLSDDEDQFRTERKMVDK